MDSETIAKAEQTLREFWAEMNAWETDDTFRIAKGAKHSKTVHHCGALKRHVADA